MSSSLREENPHGQGNTLGSRRPRASIVAGVVKSPTTWEPQPHQARMLSIDRGVIVSVGGLGSGKSEPGALLLLRWALRYPRRKDGRPTKWYAIGPTFSLIRQEMFPKILEQARRFRDLGYGTIVKRVIHGQDPRIILCGDQVILGRSGTDPDRLRGHEIDGFWGDECQEHKEKTFRVACSRLRSSVATRVVLTASPEDSPGWIWRLISGEDAKYNKVRERLLAEGGGSGLRVFRWTSADNKANREPVLGTIRAVLEASAHGTAAQELEGRFPGTSEAPALGLIEYARAFVAELTLSEREATPAVMGVDIGETHDFTWLTVLSETGVVLWTCRWQVGSPGVPREGFFLWSMNRIEEAALAWRVPLLMVDLAKSGKPVTEGMAAKLKGRVKVEGYHTDAVGKKSAAIEALGLALSRGEVKVPLKWKGPDGTEHVVEDVPQLRKEFVDLIATDVGNGKRTFHHPQGGHDDGIVSLALAFHGLGMRRPRVDLSPWLKGNKIQVPGSRWVSPFGPGYNLGGMRPFPPTRPPGPWRS